MATSNLAARFLTAGLLAPILLGILFFAPHWGWFAVVLCACAIGAHELFGMTHPADGVARWLGVLVTLGVSATVYLAGTDARVLLTMMVAVVLSGLLIPLWRLGEIATAGLRITAGVAGPLYIGVMLTTIGLLRRDLGDGPRYVVMTLTFAWLADTFGYFAGRFLGRTKLYEAVSPKKTREGYAGAVAGAVVGGAVAHFWYLPSIPLLHAVGLGALAGAVGQLGDLVESLLKRSTGIKDSGSLLPGHGGILDRIDAVLVVSPIVYVYTLWAQQR